MLCSIFKLVHAYCTSNKYVGVQHDLYRERLQYIHVTKVTIYKCLCIICKTAFLSFLFNVL